LLVHSPALVQAVPVACLPTQTLFMQNDPDTQSPFAEQLAGHAGLVPLQR
jgi:hypothetical protein